MKSSILLTLAALAATLPAFGSVSFTCAANIDGTVAGTCNYLNTTVAGNYNSTFSNVFASMYIQFGTTGLASSTTGFFNLVSSPPTWPTSPRTPWPAGTPSRLPQSPR